MKTFITILLVAAIGFATGASAKDRTQFDCRVNQTKTITLGPKLKQYKLVKVCPHQAQLAAGLCETNAKGQMRCLN
jgi:hypothetical protein